MLRVLYITSNNPWGTGGGSFASKIYLTAFCKVFDGCHMDLFVGSEAAESYPESWAIDHQNVTVHSVPPRSVLSKIKSIMYQRVHRFHETVRNHLESNSYDYCIFDRSDTAGTLIDHVKPETRIIVIHHNFEPKYYADNASLIFKIAFLRGIRKGERKAFQKAHINCFLTPEDKDVFIQEYGQNNSVNICCGLFPVEYESTCNIADTTRKIETIVITGSLSNVQSIDGMKYFMKELYPLINPEYNIIISGQKPTREIYSLIKGKNNIELISDPQDIDKIILRGNIYLCPIRLGSGIKVRITDGLKHGLPVIAHSVSARGYNSFIEDNVLFSFDSPDKFKECLETATYRLRTEELRSKDVIDSYNKNCSFDAAISILRGTIMQIR